jgi:hypothetical protein
MKHGRNGAATGLWIPPYAQSCARGRIVFDRSRDLFIIYADRKLLTPAIDRAR